MRRRRRNNQAEKEHDEVQVLSGRRWEVATGRNCAVAVAVGSGTRYVPRVKIRTGYLPVLTGYTCRYQLTVLE